MLLLGALAVGAACSEPTGPVRARAGLAYLTYGSLFKKDEVHVVNPDNGEIEEDIRLPLAADWIAVSPTGDHFAFAAQGLWIMNRDGSGARMIYAPDSGFVVTPQWSPDESEVVFTEVHGVVSALRRISASGGVPATITSQLEGTHASWSPNGLQLALGHVTYSTSEFLLSLVARDGSNAHQLTFNTASDALVVHEEPAWSPDGTRIAFMESENHGLAHIMTVSSAGTDVRGMTTAAGGDYSPVWSEDGTQIFFLRWADNNASTGFDVDVFVVDAAGGEPHRVTYSPTIPKFALMRIAR